MCGVPEFQGEESQAACQEPLGKEAPCPGVSATLPLPTLWGLPARDLGCQMSCTGVQGVASSRGPALPLSPGKAWLPDSSPLLTTWRGKQACPRPLFLEAEPEQAKWEKGAAEVGTLCSSEREN